MNVGKITIKLEDLAIFISGLVKEGILCDAEPSEKDEGFYIVELKGY